MQFTAILAFAMGINAVSAVPTLSPRNTVVYATFYNDNACKQGGGKAVSTANPGCLNESGRHSIYFQSAETDKAYDLIYSPRPNCPCQSYCNTVVGYEQLPRCTSLDGTPDAQSYRFVERQLSGGHTKCGPNNC